VLKYSRNHESEADRLGLLLMATAGYDPREAARFWKRVGERVCGAKGAEFMGSPPKRLKVGVSLREMLWRTPGRSVSRSETPTLPATPAENHKNRRADKTWLLFLPLPRFGEWRTGFEVFPCSAWL
jgi:Zn-dependent protease with chaperone function